jgi:hypothetical protein
MPEQQGRYSWGPDVTEIFTFASSITSWLVIEAKTILTCVEVYVVGEK